MKNQNKQRQILSKEVFNSESCTHLKWVIDRYVDIGDADRARQALDAFMDTFFPRVEQVEEVKPQPKEEVTQEDVSFFQSKEAFTARELAFGLVGRMECLSRDEQTSAVRSLGRQLSKSFPMDSYKGMVFKRDGNAREYHSDLEEELINTVAHWEERYWGNESLDA